MNDPTLDDLGDPDPRLPDLLVSQRHRPTHPVADLCADVALGVVLGIALYCAAIVASWWMG